MPTEFSQCEECFHLKTSPLDSHYNKPYKSDYDTMQVLKAAGLPTEIAIKRVAGTILHDLLIN
jgi:hypothetical protein